MPMVGHPLWFCFLPLIYGNAKQGGQELAAALAISCLLGGTEAHNRATSHLSACMLRFEVDIHHVRYGSRHEFQLKS